MRQASLNYILFFCRYFRAGGVANWVRWRSSRQKVPGLNLSLDIIFSVLIWRMRQIFFADFCSNKADCAQSVLLGRLTQKEQRTTERGREMEICRYGGVIKSVLGGGVWKIGLGGGVHNPDPLHGQVCLHIFARCVHAPLRFLVRFVCRQQGRGRRKRRGGAVSDAHIWGPPRGEIKSIFS